MWLRIRLLFEVFRFIKHYRERQQAERERQATERRYEREHQRLMIEAIASRALEAIRVNQEGVLELAKAQAKQADVLNTWLKSFQISPEPEPSSVVREEDELRIADERLRDIDPEAYIGQLPPEFRLAYALDKLEEQGDDPNPGFDREGRDNI